MARDLSPRGVLAYWLKKYPNADNAKLFRIFLTEMAGEKELRDAVAAEVFERALEEIKRGAAQSATQ